MTMTVKEYCGLPHRWCWGGMGGDDCTTFVATWMIKHVGWDPAIHLRGTYSTKEEANAIVDAAGGIAALVASCVEPMGINRIQQPHDGDIGIVTAMTGFDADGAAVKDIPAIKFGPLWAVMSARGPMVKRLEWTGIAWRIA